MNHRPPPATADRDLTDILTGWALSGFGVLIAAAGVLHVAVEAAARLVGRDPRPRLRDTLAAVRASPANPLAGYPRQVAEQLPPAWLVWLLVGLFVGAPLAVVVWWRRGRGPRQPDGLATRAELASTLLPKAALSRARTSRAGAVGEKRPRLDGAAMFLAAHPAGRLWVQHEDSVAVVAPPRMGKTLWLGVGAVLDAPGAVVATTTKAELVRLTAGRRGRGGRPVWVFDPENVADWPDGLRWSPVAGCDDPGVAAERSRAFVAAVPLGNTRNGDFFTQGADVVLRCLLHAAALAGATMREVAGWAADFDNDEPLNILASHPGACPGWYGNLRTFTTGAPDTVSSTKMTLGLILKPLASPRVLAAVTPEEGHGLDVAAFLAARGTLYLVSEGDDGSTAPFVTALADHVVKVAKRDSQRRPGGRLDPPLRLVLDEAANVAPLPNLPGLMSDSGGRGITTIVMVQSFAQGRRRWGDEGFAALFGSATVKLVLGGLSEADDLDKLSRLCGERRVRRTSTTRAAAHAGSVTHSEERERVLPPETIRTLPVGEALLLYRNMRPALVRLRPWWRRPDADAIRAAEQQTTPSGAHHVPAAASTASGT